MAKQHAARRPRSPRVSVPNQEQAVVAVGPKRTVGILRKLSATGGSIRLSGSFSPGTFGELTFKTTSGKVTGAIEFLPTAADPQVQGFRFVHLEPVDGRRLQDALKQLRKQGHGGESRALQPLLDLAQRTLSVANRTVRKIAGGS